MSKLADREPHRSKVDKTPPLGALSEEEERLNEQAAMLAQTAVKASVWATLASGLLAVLASMMLSYGVHAHLGVALGNLIVVLNLLALARIGRALTEGRAVFFWGMLYLIKIFALLFVVWLILMSNWVSGIALVVGLVTLVPGIVLGGLRASMSSSSLQQPSANSKGP